ncbi:hypothetical protein FQZ97_748320 [compost metagenome]
MIVVPNPLTVYIAWLSDRDLDWADSIACSFFESWQVLDETKKLLEVSKEEYIAKHQALRAYMDAAMRGEEGLTPPELDWEEGEYDYGDDEEYIPGIRLQRLVSYLDKFIELNNERYFVKIALQLFEHTDYMLLSYSVRAKLPGLNDLFRDKYIKSLLEGDLESAEKEEEELHLGVEESEALLTTKTSWDNFIIEDFNRHSILCYEMVRMYGLQ